MKNSNNSRPNSDYNSKLSIGICDFIASEIAFIILVC